MGDTEAIDTNAIRELLLPEHDVEWFQNELVIADLCDEVDRLRADRDRLVSLLRLVKVGLRSDSAAPVGERVPEGEAEVWDLIEQANQPTEEHAHG